MDLTEEVPAAAPSAAPTATPSASPTSYAPVPEEEIKDMRPEDMLHKLQEMKDALLESPTAAPTAAPTESPTAAPSIHI